MKTSLLCGKRALDFEVPDSVSLVETREMAALADPVLGVSDAISNPIGCPPLAEIASGRKDACIVISDITRPVPNKVLLPPLLTTLEQCGLPPESITILIATGMHRPNRGGELESMVGREIMDRYSIENHFCGDPKACRKIHEINGAPIEVNTRYLDSDLKILTGLIEPHFYAGFSGGRKSILPGISSYDTMKFMHSFRMIDHPNVTNCLLDGNPFHQYGVRIAELAGVDFIVNVVINKKREVAGFLAGHHEKAFLAGCDLVSEHAVVHIPDKVDLVVTSGGGYPLDSTFYQMSKALVAAAGILKPGGTILLVCECAEGLGNAEFSGIMRSVSDYPEFVERYSDPADFVMDQWCAQSIFKVLDHAGKVYVFAPGLDRKDLERMGVVKVDSIQGTMDRLFEDHAGGVVISEGPYVVGMAP